MTGFADVLLRGLMLLGGAAALGGTVFALVVLRAGPRTATDVSTTRCLGAVALGAGVVALAQLTLTVVAATTLVHALGPAAVPSFLRTTFALASLARVVIALVTLIVAWPLARGASVRMAWTVLSVSAVLLVASSAGISHAMARLHHRPLLLALDALHQLAAAIWVGGLLHLLLALRPGSGPQRWPSLARRFSSVALGSVAVLVAAGVALSLAYVDPPAALLETAYGVMVLTKAALLLAILAIGVVNFRLVRRAAVEHARLARLVEVEAGLAITVLFAAASLTSLPPAADVRADRATLPEVLARFTAMPPRLASPHIADLLEQTNPLGRGPETRLPIEREWSEFNHHWAGVFVLAMGLAAIAARAGLRPGRHWPLLLVALGLFLFVRNDPEVWPLGPIGFWASLSEPEILQHRVFVTLAVAFGVFEWCVRTDRLAPRPWALVFPLICVVGGGLLLTHSHAVFDLKEAFLMEVTHAPIGVLGAFAGWARWLELRLPEAGTMPGRLWPACLTAIGVLLLFYSEG